MFFNGAYFKEYQPYHYFFSTFFLQQTTHRKNVKTVFLHGFFLLMILEIAKATKSQTQVSMAHVPTTKSKTLHLNRKEIRSLDVFWIFFGYLWDFQMATISIKNLAFQPIVEKTPGEEYFFNGAYFKEHQPYHYFFNIFCTVVRVQVLVFTLTLLRPNPWDQHYPAEVVDITRKPQMQKRCADLWLVPLTSQARFGGNLNKLKQFVVIRFWPTQPAA